MGFFEVIEAYVYGFLILLLVLAFAVLVTLSSTIRVSSNLLLSSISQNTILLDVILFGFSAVMFGLISTRGEKRIPEGSMFWIAVVASASFLCYLVSLGLSLFSLYSDNIVLAVFSAWVAVFGVGVSSLYIVMLLLERPPSTNAVS